MKPESFLFPLFPLFFAGMWLFVTWMISRMGWQPFSLKYPAPAKPQSPGYNCSSVRFGMLASYKNAVRIHFDTQGLILSTFILFRPFHPPLRLPWPLLKSLKQRKFLWLNSYELLIECDSGSLRIVLPGKALPELHQFRPDLPVI